MSVAVEIDVECYAGQLRAAYRGSAIAPIRRAIAGASVADAYAIQQANIDHWLAECRARIGAKIGLTTRAVQTQLGVDQPDFGTLFADIQVADGGMIAAGRLLQPKAEAEAEVAFVLARPIDVDNLTLDELAGAVAHVLPAIEIVDSRIAGWDIGIIDTVADNASSGLFVLGDTPVALDRIDLRLAGMVMKKNGEIVSLGTAAACLGNPLNALGWLARTMAELGSPLGGGDVILAGALGPMVAANPGDRFTAEIGGLGAVGVEFGR